MNKKNIYSGITSDEDSWGMCCSEEAARRCAEDNYAREKKDNIKEIRSLVINFTVGILIFLVLAIIDYSLK